jgi:hypothetical protein
MIIVIITVINTDKTTIIFFTRKTDSFSFDQNPCNKLVAGRSVINYLGILLGYKIYFHSHVDYIFLRRIKNVGFVSLYYIFLS